MAIVYNAHINTIFPRVEDILRFCEEHVDRVLYLRSQVQASPGSGVSLNFNDNIQTIATACRTTENHRKPLKNQIYSGIIPSWYLLLSSFFDLILYVPSTNFQLYRGRVFLGWTSTKLGLMFLLKDTKQWRRWGSNWGPQSGVKHSTTELPCYLVI